jgi:hypothetical protein
VAHSGLSRVCHPFLSILVVRSWPVRGCLGCVTLFLSVLIGQSWPIRGCLGYVTFFYFILVSTYWLSYADFVAVGHSPVCKSQSARCPTCVIIMIVCRSGGQSGVARSGCLEYVVLFFSILISTNSVSCAINVASGHSPVSLACQVLAGIVRSFWFSFTTSQGQHVIQRVWSSQSLAIRAVSRLCPIRSHWFAVWELSWVSGS